MRRFAPMTRCHCVLNDCAYYNAVPEDPRECDCSHPDKSYYMNNATCPLYRKNWKEGEKRLEELKQKMLQKRKL